MMLQVPVEIRLTLGEIARPKARRRGPVEVDLLKTSGGEYSRYVLQSHVAFHLVRQ
jgi:hypothetical protein